MDVYQTHKQKVERIARTIRGFAQVPNRKEIRFSHGSSNSTRSSREDDKYSYVDISDLNEVVEINTVGCYAVIEPNVSMKVLVDACLAAGMVPPVVLEFPGITAGGAVNGAALESSSYRYGQFSDTCLEYEIILGTGELIDASEHIHADLFWGISGSYGSLGLVTLIKVRLLPACAYIRVTLLRCTSANDAIEVMEKMMKNAKVDFVDAIVFSAHYAVVMLGERCAEKNGDPITFSDRSDRWFYQYVRDHMVRRDKLETTIPLKEYLFRYDLGAFWMGEYFFKRFFIPHIRPTEWLFNPYLHSRTLFQSLQATNTGQDYVIQDIYCEWKCCIEFIEALDKQLGIYPLWLCPVKAAVTPQKLSPHFIDSKMLLDIGIWGKARRDAKDPIKTNRNVEETSREFGARKMLYAHAYYPKDEFWKVYDRVWYDNLRKAYHASSVFPDVWEKVHVSGRYKRTLLIGIMTVIRDNLRGHRKVA